MSDTIKKSTVKYQYRRHIIIYILLCIVVPEILGRIKMMKHEIFSPKHFWQCSTESQLMCSSETSVDFQWTTRRYIPEEKTLHNHWRENLKSYKKNSSIQTLIFQS
jgi:hypothetical protein